VIEKHLSLRKAAKLAGISHPTLKRWLYQYLGAVLPSVPHGGSIMVRERDVEYVMACRRDARNVIKRHSKAQR